MTSPDPERYLARIGLAPDDVAQPDRAALERLQRAHVTSVPFETLAITGPPGAPGDTPATVDGREGVTLTLPHLYEKVVERERGGFCFELNGAFGWLLDALGFDVDRVAGRVDETPPANHHALVVHLDRTYVVDVGVGGPRVRRPVPLDGTPVADAVGITWRVVPSDQPGVDHRVEADEPWDGGFDRRYIFDETPRHLSYFAATCDYLQTAPDSPFTGDPVVSLATEGGRKRLTADALVRYEGGAERETPVEPGEWHDVLAAEFGLAVDG